MRAAVASLYAGFLAVGPMMLWPLWLSYKYERLSASGKSKQPLERILSSDAGYQALFAFCSQEFSSENVAFYARVRAFERRANDASPATAASELLVEARAIFDTFVAEGAPFQVNIAAAHYKRVVTRLQHLEAQQTAPAVHEIATLFSEVKTGSFPRNR